MPSRGGPREDSKKALKMLELIAKEVGNGEGFTVQISRQMRCDLTSNYCAMGRWNDADREVSWLLGSLEFENIAKVHTKYNRYEEARGVYQRLHGRISYCSLLALTELVDLYKTQLRLSAASKIQHDLVAISKSTLGLRSAVTQNRLLELAELHEEPGRWLEAGILRHQAVEVSQATPDSNDERTPFSRKKDICAQRGRNRTVPIKQR